MHNTPEKAVTNAENFESEPFLQWKHKFNEKKNQYEFEEVTFADKTPFEGEKVRKAIKKATGASDMIIGETILKRIANGMSSENLDTRLNHTSALLPVLGPKNETEALLLGQFLALQDCGMKCLRRANLPEQGFYHEERLLGLAHKLLNTANQTMQTVLKYRCGGQQTMQVIHVHNEGQAIVAQNVSSSSQEKGHKEKIIN